MRASRRGKWKVIFVLLVPSLLWGEHERRTLTLVGTWQVLEENQIQTDTSFRLYQTFHWDGTGEEIVEEQGKRASFPFSYTFKGFSRLEIVSDHSFCGTNVVFLGDPCLGTDGPKGSMTSILLSISLDRNRMYLNLPKSYSTTPQTYWRRVTLKQSP